MTGTGAAGLPADLLGWVADVTGRPLRAVDRLPGGNRREAWRIDLAEAGPSSGPDLLLRLDPEPVDDVDPYTLWREADAYRILASSAVRAPRLVAVHPSLQAMLTERVPGASSFYVVADVEERRAVARDFMRQLAAVHAITAADADLSSLGPVTSIGDCTRSEITTWARMYRATLRPDPLIEFGLAWLEDNLPCVDEAPVLVHGDAGPGNFLFADGKVQAVIDWEFSHPGDPMEDLAWLSMRSVFEPFPELDDRLAEYEVASGRRIDVARVRFHRVLVQWRVAVIRHRDAGSATPNGDVANGLISRTVNRRLLVEAIADVTGVVPPATAPLEPAGDDDRWLYDAALHLLAEVVVPRSVDALATRKAKGVARIVKFLREAKRFSGAAGRAELSDLGDLLGAVPQDLASGRALLAERVQARGLDPAAVLDHLWRQVLRDAEMTGPVVGSLRHRHLAPLGRFERADPP